MQRGHRSDKKTRFAKARLSVFIALALSTPLAMAQDAVKPGLYTTVDQDEIYIIQGGQQIDVKTGETVRVTADGLQFVDSPPAFLAWPCGTGFAPNRGGLETFSASSLPPGDEIAAVAQRYFESAQVLEGNPRWLNGESHMSLPAEQIDQFVSNASWYQAGPPDAMMAAQRPDTLLIGLFFGTGQVVVDNNQLPALKEKYGDDPIPVVFQYQEENVVPISFFGAAPTPQMIMRAFQENGVKLADVPMWYAGDKHLEVPPGELASMAGVPPASEMDPARLQQMQDDLRENGFGGKPVTMAMTSGGDAPIIAEGARLRAAEAMGMGAVPVMFSAFDSSSHASFCGLAPPVAAAGALGTFTDDDSATPLDEGDQGTGLEDPLGPDDPRGPDEPQIPPEIELPNPPPPELPASEN
jgi:hypothetical protein